MIVAAVLTPASIFVSYTDWGLLSDDPEAATALFSRWPWVKGTFLLTAGSFAWPYFAWWRSRGDYDRFDRIMSAYIMVLFGAMLFFYPGASALGIHSDHRWWVFVLVPAIQYAGARLVAQGVFPRAEPVPAWNLARAYMDEFAADRSEGCDPVSEDVKSFYVKHIAPVLEFAVRSVRFLDVRKLNRNRFRNVRPLVALYLAGAAREFCDRQELTPGQSRVVTKGVLWACGWPKDAAWIAADQAAAGVERLPELEPEGGEALTKGAEDFREFQRARGGEVTERLRDRVRQWSRRRRC